MNFSWLARMALRICNSSSPTHHPSSLIDWFPWMLSQVLPGLFMFQVLLNGLLRYGSSGLTVKLSAIALGGGCPSPCYPHWWVPCVPVPGTFLTTPPLWSGWLLFRHRWRYWATLPSVRRLGGFGVLPQCPNEKIRLQKRFKIDELDSVKLLMALEEEFAIEITDEEAESIKTVKELIDPILSSL